MSARAVSKPKPAAKIPSVTTLRSLLKQTNESDLGGSFQHAVTAFRTLYRNRHGVFGTEFRKWRYAEHRHELFVMADTFLDTNRNGIKFWPDDKKAENYNADLQYSKHREKSVGALLPTPPKLASHMLTNAFRIREWLVELFFQQNVQQHRNTQARGKRKARPLRPGPSALHA